jgi:hypothetical protein
MEKDGVKKKENVKKKQGKNDKIISVKWFVVIAVLAIVLSFVISVIVLNVSSPVKEYSSDTGTILVNVVEPGNMQGKIIVNVQGGEK